MSTTINNGKSKPDGESSSLTTMAIKVSPLPTTAATTATTASASSLETNDDGAKQVVIINRGNDGGRDNGNDDNVHVNSNGATATLLDNTNTNTTNNTNSCVNSPNNNIKHKTKNNDNNNNNNNNENTNSPTRKSNRSRHSPSRYIARPSKQGFGVVEGDQVFLCQQELDLNRANHHPHHDHEKKDSNNEHTTATSTGIRSSKRLREQLTINTAEMGSNAKQRHNSILPATSSRPNANVAITSVSTDGGRLLPMRAARARNAASLSSSSSSLFGNSHANNYSATAANTTGTTRAIQSTSSSAARNNNSHGGSKKYDKEHKKIMTGTTPSSSPARPTSSKLPPSTTTAAAAADRPSNPSGAPRPPRTIIIGAGISGLACARELSARRHDVLVLEARHRLGGRLRTVDLMLDDGTGTTDTGISNINNINNNNNHNGKEDGIMETTETTAGGWNINDTKTRSSDLFNVQKWCPVDVGGAFIHGTGQTTTSVPSPSHHVGSHDFGTSSSSRSSKQNINQSTNDGTTSAAAADDSEDTKKQPKKQRQPPLRKSDRLSRVYDTTATGNNNSNNNNTQNNRKRQRDGTSNYGHHSQSNLNPVYILAHQKLRLPLTAADGAFTYLVDHNGNFIGEELDEQVSWEFNEVLDLATKCCESGRYEWRYSSSKGVVESNSAMMPSNEKVDSVDDMKKKKEEHVATTSGSGDAHELESLPSLETSDGSLSPKTVAGATIVPIGVNKYSLTHSQQNNNDNHDGSAIIDPSTDFGTIFEECKKHLQEKMYANNNTHALMTDNQGEVRKNLFQWHIANLEMSSGAPMNMLGQKWNDDEPYGFGGDHSYLEGGFRDVIEALADGFECHGSTAASGVRSSSIRRSGDLVSGFQRNFIGPSSSLSSSQASLGLIQCGIEISGVKVVEREEALQRRKKRRKSAQKAFMANALDKSMLRRSNRQEKGSKMRDYLNSLKSRTQIEHLPKSWPDPPLQSAEEPSTPKSSYGCDQSTVVQVTTKCGLTFEADAVIVTVPLAILSIPPNEPGHISFDPPLSTRKLNALGRLGVGAYNKCCMSFEKPFWKHLPRQLSSTALPNWTDAASKRFDFIGHASAEHGKDILFFNLKNAPILIAIYGGSDYSCEVEDIHDKQVIAGCMEVLRKIFSKARDDCRKTRRLLNDLTIPDWPLDYFVTRWGSDPFSRGAFCYVPPGVNGFEELSAMSEPIYEYCPENEDLVEDAVDEKKARRPLIMFAGEATTPYHPSTVHGAFETGVREAYRLDLALEPALNGLKFDESYLYQPTFVLRRGPTQIKISTQQEIKMASPNENLTDKPHFKASLNRINSLQNDISLLRGVESFTCSAEGMSRIKEKMITNQDEPSEIDIDYRYKSLMHMIGVDGTVPEDTPVLDKWLANDVPQVRKERKLFEPMQLEVERVVTHEDVEEETSDNSNIRRSSRKSRKKVIFDA